MLSFAQFLLEELQPLPGKNRGHVDYEIIDGHEVHVRYPSGLLRKSTIRPSVTVNGKYYKETEHPPETARKITGFVKNSFKNYIKKVHPGKVKIKANDPKKAEAYRAFAHSQTAQAAGFKAKDTKKGVTMKNKGSEPYVPSGIAPRDRTNPAQATPAGKKWWKSDKEKFWKKKNKGNFKEVKFQAKGKKIQAKGAFKGGGGTFGGGGGSGSW